MFRPLRVSLAVQQFLAVSIPLLALAISVLVVYPQWQAANDLHTEIAGKRAQLSSLEATPLPDPSGKRPAVRDTETEQSEFLGAITGLAASAGCDVVALDAEATAGEGPATLVRPLRTKLTVRGRYGQIRVLLSRLNRSSRLYVVRELSAVPTTDNLGIAVSGRILDTTITIDRYVIAPGGDVASAG